MCGVNQMLNLYNSCCKQLIDPKFPIKREVFEHNEIQRRIEFRSIKDSTNFIRNVISFNISNHFSFSFGYLLDTKNFYIVNNGSMVTNRIDLDKEDEIDRLSDIEKVLIHGRMITDKELAMRLLYDDDTDSGFMEIVNFIKE